MKLLRSVWLVPALGFALSCGSETDAERASAEVGGACVPSLESDPSFSGFSMLDVSVEARGCQHSACIVNHVQGRVSCPYGQTEMQIDTLDASDPARCRLPGSGLAVEVPVEPQRIYRNARDNVYCSCRCDGPDRSAEYCDCPSGYACTPLVEEYGLPLEAEVAGAYCVKEGTQWNPQKVIQAEVCEAEAAKAGRRTPDRRYDVAEVCGGKGANP